MLSRKEKDQLNAELLLASETGETDTVQSLLERGADIKASNKNEETALHRAALKGQSDAVRLLLDRGAEIDAKDGAGSRVTALHKGAISGHTDTVGLLLDRGAEIYATGHWGQTPLDFAASNGRLETLVLLLERGANMEATAKYITKALDSAATFGYPDMVHLLVDRGADIDALNEYGRTALHSAAYRGKLDCVVALLEGGANMEAEALLRHTALHEAASYGHSDIVRVLLERGANIEATSKSGQTALSCAIQLTGRSSDAKSHYETAKTMCEMGATWDKSCDLDDSTTDQAILASTAGVRACVHHWIAQRARDPSATLDQVPIENVKEGKESVDTYLSAMANTVVQDIVRRRKLCVVGPSCSGKTSLVKSLQEIKTVMVQEEDRTIGIDLFGLDWDAPNTASETGKYEATIWDFAGQDVYQVAHSLYFSKRTLYLVFVNVEKYYEQLQFDDTSDIKQYETRLSRWVRDNIFNWVQLILGRQPDAELVIVCSKCDKVDATIVAAVVADLGQRLSTWAAEFVSEHEGPVQQEIQKSVGEFTDRKRLRLSITTQETVEMALRDVQAVVSEKPERAYLMPKLYTQVLDTVDEIRKAATATASEADRVEKLLVQSDKLVEDLMDKIDGLKRRECRDILGTLHALGDILWFEQERHFMSAGSGTIVLDPRLMLDLVREVVNHELQDREGAEYDALRTHGELKHSLLSTFPLWGVLCKQSPERVLYFKQLLKHFNLAYAVGNQAMAWDADLVVPCYWKTKKQSAGGVVDDAASANAYANEAVWQYTVPANVSETIFDQFIVQSHDVEYDRSVLLTGVVMSKADVCRASIGYNEGKKPSEDVIVIRVEAESVDECWKTLECLVVSMEHVLEGYPGLGTVRRHVLKKGARKTAEYDVMRLIKNEVCDAATMVAKVKALLHPPSASA